MFRREGIVISGLALMVRLLPMTLVALASSAQGVLIPQVFASFGLSLSLGGILVALQQSASVVTMLVTGLLVARYGAVAVLLGSAATIAVGALSASLAPTYGLVFAFLWLVGIGASSIAAATNALMAETGPRRAFYLGMMHSTYSLLSIGGPLLAGAVVAWATWREYYRLLVLLTLFIAVILWRYEGGKRRKAGAGGRPTPFSSLVAQWRGMGSIYWLCLGIVFMTGTQASLATWGYSYMVEVYGSPHQVAAMATSLYWAGILVGRLAAIPLSAKFSEKGLLLSGIALCFAALAVDWLAQVPGAAMAALVVAGYGVSGAFQLGTAWAAAVEPEKIPVASSLVMASASLGALVLPMTTAFFADHFGFAAFRWLMLIGYLVSAGAFLATPWSTPSATPEVGEVKMAQ